MIDSTYRTKTGPSGSRNSNLGQKRNTERLLQLCQYGRSNGAFHMHGVSFYQSRYKGYNRRPDYRSGNSNRSVCLFWRKGDFSAQQIG